MLSATRSTPTSLCVLVFRRWHCIRRRMRRSLFEREFRQGLEPPKDRCGQTCAARGRSRLQHHSFAVRGSSRIAVCPPTGHDGKCCSRLPPYLGMTNIKRMSRFSSLHARSSRMGTRGSGYGAGPFPMTRKSRGFLETTRMKKLLWKERALGKERMLEKERVPGMDRRILTIVTWLQLLPRA